MTMKQNLYELLNVEAFARTEEIEKAFRKQSLKCHPDRNPDNPEALELFHKLMEAKDILCNEKLRAEYDAFLKAEIEQKRRHNDRDQKTKKFAQELHEREQSLKKRKSEVNEVNRKEEIKRQNMAYMEQLSGSRMNSGYKSEILKKQDELRFNAGLKKNDFNVPENKRTLVVEKNVSEVSIDDLKSELRKFGPIESAVVISDERIYVTFTNKKDAQAVLDSQERTYSVRWMIPEYVDSPNKNREKSILERMRAKAGKDK
jgi:DnaJ family protein C protein 17